MNRRLNSLLGIVVGLMMLGCWDTASAQTVTLTVSPLQLNFNNILSGATSAPQNVSLSANQGTSVIIQPTSTSTWLSVTPNASLNIGPTPTNLSVRVNAQGLAAGTYQGGFTISFSGTTAGQVTVNVSVTVTGSSALTATPPSIAFSAVQNAQTGTPTATTVRIASSGNSLGYTISASTINGNNWLLLGAASGTTGDPGFSVSVNPAGLSPGTYVGAINVQSTTTADSVQLTVTLTITGNASLSVTPSVPPAFLYQLGGTAPSAQQLTVTATGGTLPFSVALSPSVPWLVVNPLSGSAGTSPAVLTLSASPTGLVSGVYSTSVIVTPQGGNALTPVPITLIIGPNPLLQLSRGSLTFTAAFAGAAPADQSINVSSVGTGPAVGFTFSSDSTWLSAVATASVAPASLSVHVNPFGLQARDYTGRITVRPSNGDPYSQVIVVNLTVTTAAQLTASPPALLFSYQTNQGTPQPQTVRVEAGGQAVPFTVSTSTSNCGANWLTATTSAGATPAAVTLSITTTGMVPGVCSGSLSVSYNSGLGLSTVTVPVSVAISNSAELSISLPPGFGLETVQQGADPFLRTIALTSTDPVTQVIFSATATSGGLPWLLIGSGATLTPQNLTLQFVPGNLAPGTYQGTVTITSPSLPNSTTLVVPVVMTVAPRVTVSVSPTTVTFNQAQGGALPADQNITIASTPTGVATFAATLTQGTGGDWLSVSPGTGAANGTVTLTVKAHTLTKGNYTQTLTITFQNTAVPPVTIPVSLNVTDPVVFSVSPAGPLVFTYQITGAAPAPQRLSVNATGGTVAFTAGTTSSGWLVLDSTSGSTNKDLAVSINPAGLTPGTYNGSISVSAPGVISTPIAVAVTLTVTAAPAPLPATVTNNASNVAGPIAGGEILTIKGTLLGPASPAQGTLFSVNSQGTLNTSLAGVRVLFDNIPGIPLYVSANQINVIAPWEIAGRVTVNLVIEYQNVQSVPISVRVDDAAPGIYTLNSTGLGQSAAINQNGTFNGPGGNTTPAPPGSIVVLYATGGGQTNPFSLSGTVNSTTQLQRLQPVSGQPVTATVGGVPAQVLFAGAAPGLVTGVVQVNLVLPPGVTGTVPVNITVNGKISPGGPTLAIQ